MKQETMMKEKTHEEIIQDRVSRKPDFVNYTRVSAWKNIDKNGNPYLTLQMGTVNLFAR